MAAGPIAERNQDATVYVGGLDDKVTEAILWELFLQAGPVVNVHMPKDRVTQSHQGYGFVEFMGEEDADYAIKIMNMIKLYGKPVRVNKASAHQKNLDVGANIFIGNLDPEVDEKLLYDTFSAFGVILQTPKIMRDPDSGNSKGYAFINFASFEASDAAIEAMNGQYLCNRAITISYAFKKDSKGERHGSAAERLLAAKNPLSLTDRPHQLFADAPPPPQQPPGGPGPPSSMAPPPPPPMGGLPPATGQQAGQTPTSMPNVPPPPVPPPSTQPQMLPPPVPPMGMPPFPPGPPGHGQMPFMPPPMPRPPPPSSGPGSGPPTSQPQPPSSQGQGGMRYPGPPPPANMNYQQRMPYPHPGQGGPPPPPPPGMRPPPGWNGPPPPPGMRPPPFPGGRPPPPGMRGPPPPGMMGGPPRGPPGPGGPRGPPPPRMRGPPPPGMRGPSYHRN